MWSINRAFGGNFPEQRTPHSSSELSEATDETSHADDGIGDGDTASADVVHGKDESGAGKREEAAAEGI